MCPMFLFDFLKKIELFHKFSYSFTVHIFMNTSPVGSAMLHVEINDRHDGADMRFYANKMKTVKTSVLDNVNLCLSLYFMMKRITMILLLIKMSACHCRIKFDQTNK